MPEPYSNAQAVEILRRILKNDGDLEIRAHCYARMAERSVDDLDIELVLEENGAIHCDPEFDEKHHRWKYSVDGYDSENQRLRVVVNISEQNWRVTAISVVPDWKERKQ